MSWRIEGRKGGISASCQCSKGRVCFGCGYQNEESKNSSGKRGKSATRKKFVFIGKNDCKVIRKGLDS